MSESASTICKMPSCNEPVFRLGACQFHWEWLNGVRDQIRSTMEEAVTMSKLSPEPCPFCGSASLSVQERAKHIGPGWVSCNACGADGPMADEPIAAWNTRDSGNPQQITPEAIAEQEAHDLAARTQATPSPELVDGALRERVRDFIYDCTKDEFNTGWTLSAHQTDDLIAIVTAALSAIGADERLRIAREALKDAREAIASLDDDAFGFVDVPPEADGETGYQYPIRDELLAKIDTALASMGEKQGDKPQSERK